MIVAPQLLESMIDNVTPTRAETGDVATAIYQGVDAVMLSAETAVGRHPATAVAIMGRIIKAAEGADDYRRSLDQFAGEAGAPTSVDVTAEAVQGMAASEGAGAVALRTGSIRRLARFSTFRGRKPILYGSAEESRLRRAQLLWGTHPIALEAPEEPSWPDALMEKAGLDGTVAYAAWRGEAELVAWELGVRGQAPTAERDEPDA